MQQRPAAGSWMHPIMTATKAIAGVRGCLITACLLCSLAAAAAPGDGNSALTPAPAAADAAATASAATATAVPAEVEAPDVANAVVKVFSTMRYPDVIRPWTKQQPSEVTGSGVVIDGQRILTNAHVVLYASQVQVQANQAGDKISATVEALAPGIDLAVLKLEDASFFDTHAPIKRAAAVPQIKDAVLAYGFPTGGTSLSITKGIVSRIEFAPYGYSVSGLRIQIDAAINPGNSGGPAVAGDRMIGLAFSALSNAQNIGYIIPNEEIDLFLQDIADGHYDGKPALFDELQTLENPALRSFLKLANSVHGIVVRRPYQGDPANPLKEWDVITHIADSPVDDQGMIHIGGDLRVSFRYLVQKVAKNGTVPLTIERAGQSLKVTPRVASERPSLIPELKGEYPPYFIYGPVVFSKVTGSFVNGLLQNGEWLRALSTIGSPMVTLRSEMPTPEREELVVISSPFFPNKLSKGYSNAFGTVVWSVNGTRVRSLRHLVALLRDLKDEFVVMRCEQWGGETLVFPRREMVAATEDILSDNGVRAQGSPELMEVWSGKSAK
jgi:S1-C subfamily serine protease